jgi:release factor glutamine methyltransferase
LSRRWRVAGKPCRILDLGTGTGAIALALASERPDCQVTAVDVMPMRWRWRRVTLNISLSLTSRYCKATGLARWPGSGCHMIVSNPPYIDEADPHLAQGDVRFEPKTALVAADGGLADLAHIIREGRRIWLRRRDAGTRLDAGEAVRALFREAGYGDVATCRDYWRQRASDARRISGGV